MRRAPTLVVALSAVLAVCEPEPTALKSSPEDGAEALAFVNGSVLTLDPVTRVEEAVAIRGSRIVKTGSTREILRYAGPNATVVDLDGRTLMPGFVDPHSHWFQFGWLRGLETWEESQRMAFSHGTTTMGEPSIEEDFLPGFVAWAEAGNLRLRTNLYLLAHTDVCGRSVSDWWKSLSPGRRPQDRLWIAGVKMFTDGGACNRPAESVEFASGAGLGDLYATADEVAELVTEAEALGFQAVVHALGDRAVDVALDGYEKALDGRPNRLRHRMDHNYVTRDDQVGRYSEIGVIPVVFPTLWPAHLEFQFLGAGVPGCASFPRNEFYQGAEGQLRKLLDANPGFPVSWHNDNPAWAPLRPLSGLHGMVTRIGVRRAGDGIERCFPEAWMAATAVTVVEALEMMTVNAAYALGREEQVGSLEPGKFADLIVLSDNPTAVDPPAIWDINIWMTMVGGQVEFCLEGREAYCPGMDGH